jgi:hypothetical protein
MKFFERLNFFTKNPITVYFKLIKFLKKETDFLLNQVFGDKWTDFKQLALLAYADQATFQDFWTINNTQDVVDFIQRNGQVIA